MTQLYETVPVVLKYLLGGLMSMCCCCVGGSTCSDSWENTLGCAAGNARPDSLEGGGEGCLAFVPCYAFLHVSVWLVYTWLSSPICPCRLLFNWGTGLKFTHDSMDALQL